jgi:hypothetical protein
LTLDATQVGAATDLAAVTRGASSLAWKVEQYDQTTLQASTGRAKVYYEGGLGELSVAWPE